MLAFTIQFPNNNPAPPQTHPRGNNPQPPPQRMKTTNHHHASAPTANTGQTPKHQEPLANPNQQPPPAPNTHNSASKANSQSPARQGGLLPQNPTACQTIQATQHHHHLSNTPKDAYSTATAPHSHSQYPARTTQPHQGADQAHALSSTEFIDIPPMSNPPGQHSCPAWATKKWLAP